MTRWRLLAVGCVLAAVGAGYAVVTDHDGGSPAAPEDASAVVPGRTVHVETGTPSVRFIPLGPAPHDGWSAQHAYNALVQDPSKLSPIPATVLPYYGLLHDRSATLGSVNRRVWAFAVESGCDHGASRAAPVARVGSSARCRLWEFVDARTGHSLGVVSQEVLPE